jgi:hypothetical protein
MNGRDAPDIVQLLGTNEHSGSDADFLLTHYTTVSADPGGARLDFRCRPTRLSSPPVRPDGGALSENLDLVSSGHPQLRGAASG